MTLEKIDGSFDLAAPGSPPPLRNGERLSRAEFELRFDATSNLKKAELIDGVVSIPGPTPFRGYALPLRRLHGWLFRYEIATPGIDVSLRTSVRLAQDSMPQPDLVAFISSELGGRTRISDDDYIEGGLELVVEVSSSTANIDMNQKFQLYRRNGVQEYLVVRVLDRQIDWFRLRDGEYHRLPADASGILRSEVFPGLWLDAPALLGGDLPAVLATLDQGVNSPEHASFVDRLRVARERA